MSAPRPLPYTRDELARLIAPRRIAIVGASARAGSFGRATQANLADFAGAVDLINPRGEALDGRPANTSLHELPSVPDLAVLSVPREAVLPVLRDCAARGVGGAIVYASGFAETARPEHAALQADIAQLARASGLRVLGPNCMGLVNHVVAARCMFLPFAGAQLGDTPAIGIVSQSGALGQALSQAQQRGVAVSHILTCGNACDVDVADLVAYLAHDPACRAIACVLEGMADPRRLLHAARAAAQAGKPLVVMKLASGQQGAEAAASHTGALAGAHAVYVAALEHEAAVVVSDFEALIETAAFLAKAPAAPFAAGVAVVATSGGAAIMAADQAELHGVALPQPDPATQATLAAHVPEFGSPRNPCDVTAQVVASPESFRACCDALLADAAFGAIVMPQPYAYDAATPRTQVLGELAARQGKMACNVWLSEWLQGPGAEACEQHPNVALFRSMSRCMGALAAWQRRAAQLTALKSESESRPEFNDDRARAAALLAAHGPQLTERTAKQVLACYGVPVVEEAAATDADSAVAAAQRIGWPVVMKLESPDIPHKSEHGLVLLNLRDEAAVRAGYATLMARGQAITPAPRIDGVLVQAMAPAGLEIVVGARRDPQFGPVVLVGLGGVLVELLRDTQVLPAPVTARQAHGMLARLRGAALLKGFRGSVPVDTALLADIIAAISRLADDQADQLVELDVNPLVCRSNDIRAVDALMQCG